MKCDRIDCREQAEAESILICGSDEPKVYHLCLWHYLEVKNVVMGIKALTGIPITTKEERIAQPIGCVECGSVYLAPDTDPPRCRSCADGL